ncbi:hypothetical protein B0H17DRAFT_1179207 [Mycena rosella]|uniref:Uncharacterized protein n=1 Tax=Mycena rosella TaxID=1033263 RepID=A0AAD7GL39_MYCRO|nr:hypothetical protein B0H17DRAFT_1179207 [Mycena rosella]
MPNRHKDIYWSLALSLYCAAAELFLYGIYVVLFCSCIRALRTCRIPHRRLLLAAVSVIFVCCTLHAALQLVNAAELMTSLLHHSKLAARRWDQVNIVMGALYVTSNLIADSIFIYRCYGIWNFRKRIICVPIVLLIATGCLGYASVIMCGLEGLAEFLFVTWLFPLSVIFTLMTNAMLMALTAGRIWWIARGARAIMGPAVVRRYRTVIAIILESGVLYCTPGLLYLIFLAVSPASTVVIFAALAQVVGIAPTIIVVRVGLGDSVDSVDSFRAGDPQVDERVLDLRPDSEELDFWDRKKFETETV